MTLKYNYMQVKFVSYRHRAKLYPLTGFEILKSFSCQTCCLLENQTFAKHSPVDILHIITTCDNFVYPSGCSSLKSLDCLDRWIVNVRNCSKFRHAFVCASKVDFIKSHKPLKLNITHYKLTSQSVTQK